jgi:hypothetical protein
VESVAQQAESEIAEIKEESEKDTVERFLELLGLIVAPGCVDGFGDKVVVCVTHAVGMKRVTNLWSANPCTFFDIKFCCVTSLLFVKKDSGDKNGKLSGIDKEFEVFVEFSNHIDHYKQLLISK